MPGFPTVLGGRVVGLQVRRDLAGGRQQAVFLLVERLVPFRQQAIDLPGRDVHSQLQQLLVQERLRDVVVEMLVQHILPERRTEMRVDILRQGGGEDRPVRQLVAAAAVSRVVRLDPQVLDGEILISEELRAGREALERQRHVVMNDQEPRLGAFGGPGPFSVGRLRLLTAGRRWRAAGVIQRAGLRLAFRLVRQSLQPPDFLFELLDSPPQLFVRCQQLINHVQQCFNERSSLLRRNLNATNSLRAGLPYHAQR